MSDWLRDWLHERAESNGGDTLLRDDGVAWDRRALTEQVARLASLLQARRQPRAPVALLADNSPDWIAVDLATQTAGITLVPLPTFFTPGQWQHVVRSSGVQAIFCAQPEVAQALGFTLQMDDGPLPLHQSANDIAPVADLDGIQKITFTSGTTAEPKGVCLSSAQQWDVARSLHAAVRELELRKHLVTLPLSVLLENIAGCYTAMLTGAEIVCPPLAEIGLSGVSGFDPVRCLEAIARAQAESLILLPQMLMALVAASAPNDARVRSLKFVAVGGARVPPSLLAAARNKGFPIYEGYGLSECCSVVTLNVPGANRPGSVGKPLGNRRLRIRNGEIDVAGHGFLRYLGDAAEVGEWLPTGDLGHLDKDGFLHIDGRRKNLLITSYGRNISPEWPESALMGTGLFAQAVVFGEARPALVAALVPHSTAVTKEQMQSAVEAANATLPDYASIRGWIAVPPFTLENGLATANGRPRRGAILARHQQNLDQLYDTMEV